jgi:hypothetical protein
VLPACPDETIGSVTGIACSVCGSEPLTLLPDATSQRPAGLPLPPPYEEVLGRPPYEVCPNCGARLVEIDEEGELRKRAAWAEIGLPRLAVVGWSPVSAGSHGVSISVGGKRVATSDGWSYQDELGRLLEVEVVRPDGARIADEQERAVFSVLYAYARAVHGDDTASYGPEVERVKEAVRTGSRGWRTESFVVDSVPTSFETLNLGRDFWIAVAQLTDCIVAVKSHGVRREEVALTRAVGGDGSG